MSRADGRGPLLVLAAATLWGTAGTAQELGPPEAWPPAVAALRTLTGGAVLLAVVVAWRGRAAIATVARVARGPLLGAAAAISVFQWAYFTGIRAAGVAVGTLLAIGSAPVWAGVLEALAGRRPGRRWMTATGVTVVGTALLVLGGSDAGAGPDAGTTSPAGVVTALTAGAAYATYTVASKRMVDREVDGTAGVALTFAVSGVLLVPALLPHGVAWIGRTDGLVMIAWLAVGTIALAYTLFAAGLRSVDAPTATTLTLAEPLTATVLAVAVVGERLSAGALAGAALVTVGLALAGRGRRVDAPADPTPGRAVPDR
ncbi:DMT family transporter [Egicoccus halophilus]|uniref:Transporter n=1 Tax=Egicoccus halophilus TaxID=1670830 RepID=A0A8J3ESW4_9ACTN|nr:EamA family transporter [Egicoccus halophilus]GGI08292.1 transporter [Egicoccus halophilus]